MAASNKEIIAQRRNCVLASYLDAKENNRLRYLEGDDNATSEYIYPNQMEDANNIVDIFYKNDIRAVSVPKKTKVGADGLMIEVAKLLTTHIDDSFVVNLANVRFITGMSNVGWENEMIKKAPTCFKSKIFHHGKLQKADLMNIQNGLIIIDEIDTGDKECQRLHSLLKEAGILDVHHMQEHNNRFVFISATPIKELYDLYRWGKLHQLYKMTIPPSYIGHIDFLEKGLIKEFYPLTSQEDAERWIQEDIIDNYGADYRVHFVRVAKNVNILQDACIKKDIIFKNHTSDDRLSEEEWNSFKDELNNHIVVGVKRLLCRANLIPNSLKLRIGAMHELHTKKVDYNVQIQGLVGRMTGYWREDIENGHKTGPYRTSIKAIEEYEKTYEDPFGDNSYESNGLSKKNGKVNAGPTMLSAKNIKNLIPIDLPEIHPKGSKPIVIIENLSDDEIHIIKQKNVENIKQEIIQKHTPEIITEYYTYKFHIWLLNTSAKCKKWGLNRMSRLGAYSTESCVKVDDKQSNQVMMFLYEPERKLFISPWNGDH